MLVLPLAMATLTAQVNATVLGGTNGAPKWSNRSRKVLTRTCSTARMVGVSIAVFASLRLSFDRDFNFQSQRCHRLGERVGATTKIQRRKSSCNQNRPAYLLTCLSGVSSTWFPLLTSPSLPPPLHPRHIQPKRGLQQMEH